MKQSLFSVREFGKTFIALLVVISFAILSSSGAFAADRAKLLKPFKNLSKESANCASCHKKENPSIYQQWGNSKHYGANVGCYECHKADVNDPDVIRHKDFLISVIVSPKDCGECHNEEARQFAKSHHAKAGDILGSLDNVLAEVVEGAPTLNGHSPVNVSGCSQCHGSKVEVLPNGDLNPATWPNTGIGRINPDGSKGACNACHQRHQFSIEQVRRPEACGYCHLGPDHPQKEIYEESKHGVSFYSNVDKMALDSPKWVAGEDYEAAPTCATCHMSATTEMPITHDLGDRISWNLRAPISQKIDAKALAKGEKVKPWLLRRKDMKSVCRSCHSGTLTNNFYEQFDGVVNLYNDKFAKPGAKIMKALKENKLISKDVSFDDEVEWTWFELWHHQGRRARHGAAMQAPDFVQWEGMYEVAKTFYVELVPQVRELIAEATKEGNKAGADAVQKVLDEILASKEHKWFNGHAVKAKHIAAPK